MTTAAITAPEELRMQQPDVAAFEAEFQVQASEHAHTVDCGHHHAEEVHIDRPEDHGAHVTNSHEGEHDHHEHVHGKGCGHVGYEDASEHIDVPHEHNEHCGHLHHGDAKAHVDEPHEEHTAHHDAAERKHEHHAGCGHVGYEKAEASVDKSHVHDEHCGHVHHTKAEVHVGHDQKQIHEKHDHSKHEHHAGCGHVGYEQADAHIDHDHGYETEIHSHPQTEQAILSTVAKDVEKVHHQQLADVQEQIVRTHAEDVRITSETEVVPAIETAKVVEVTPLLERPIEHAEQRKAENVASSAIDIVEEKVAGVEEYEPLVETVALEMEVISDTPKVDLDYDRVSIQPEIPEPVTVATTEQPTLQPLQLVYEDEPALERSVTEGTISTETATVIVDEVTINEMFESLDIKPATLPVFDVEALNDTSATLPDTALESTPTSQLRGVEPAQVMSKSLAEVATAIAKRYEDIEGRLASAAPQQMQEIQKALTNIRAAFQLSREQGTMPENVQRQLAQLLQLLGFEDPSQALASYIHQYGIDFVDALMTRLFELLNQGQYFENLHMLLPQSSDDQNTGLTARLGAAVIRLVAGLGEQLPLSVARAA